MGRRAENMGRLSSRVPLFTMLALSGCGRVGFDLLARESDTVGGSPDAAAGGAGSGGASSTGGVAGSSSVGGATSGGGGSAGSTGGSSLDASGAPDSGSSSGGAPADSAAPGDDGAGSVAACPNVGPLGQRWSFDTNVEGWIFTMSTGGGVLGWNGTVGSPAGGAPLGAVEADIAETGLFLGWVELDAAFGDLSQKVLSGWVFVDGNETVTAKMFVHTNGVQTSEYWADGGSVLLAPRTWTCVSISMSSPGAHGALFDPTQVTRFGVQLEGNGANARVYLDELGWSP